MSFVPLKGFTNDYEILNRYPFTIRRKSNHFICKDAKHIKGYIRVCLNGNYYLKHVLIARQFIPNDDPQHKIEVDHINRNRADYHLSNLRWITPTDSNYNRDMPKIINARAD